MNKGVVFATTIVNLERSRGRGGFLKTSCFLKLKISRDFPTHRHSRQKQYKIQASSRIQKAVGLWTSQSDDEVL